MSRPMPTTYLERDKTRHESALRKACLEDSMVNFFSTYGANAIGLGIGLIVVAMERVDAAIERDPRVFVYQILEEERAMVAALKDRYAEYLPPEAKAQKQFQLICQRGPGQSLNGAFTEDEVCFALTEALAYACRQELSA